MNAFNNASLVEAKGMAVLMPFLAEKSDGRLVILENTALARALQQSAGDVIFSLPSGAWSAEIKVEEENKFRNLFLETWSNRNLENRDSHMLRGSNPGWMFKITSSLLLYYFLREDQLYVFDLFKLKQWAFGSELAGKTGNIYRYPEKRQGKRVQLNDTRGRCVPLSVLYAEVGYRLLHPKQLPLFEDEELLA